MDWREQSPANCSVARTIEVIGERWTLLVLREVFNGVHRFDDMQRRLGIPRPMLSDRLHRLVDADVLGRREYREPGQRVRHEYRLTETGLALQTVIIALMEWGDRHRGDPAGPPRTIHHRDCGAPVHLGLICDAGHTLTSPRDAIGRQGPGAIPMVAPAAES